MLAALGRLWVEGASPDWRGLRAGGRDRARASIDPPSAESVPEPAAEEATPVTAERSGETPVDAAPAVSGDFASTDPAANPVRQWAPEPVQERLAALWMELLGVQPSPSDDFFLLGGHSLLATQLASRIHDTFGVEVEMRAIFASRSLAALASVIEAAADDEPELLSQEEALALV